MLRCVPARHHTSWSSCLPCVEYSYNSLVLTATGVSSFVGSLGYQPPLFDHQDHHKCLQPQAPSHTIGDQAIMTFLRALLSHISCSCLLLDDTEIASLSHHRRDNKWAVNFNHLKAPRVLHFPCLQL